MDQRLATRRAFLVRGTMDLVDVPRSVKDDVRRLVAEGFSPVVCAFFHGKRFMHWGIRFGQQTSQTFDDGTRCIVVG